MRDYASNVSVKTLIDPSTLSADNTPAAVDLRDSNSCAILLAIGAGGITFTGTNKVEFVLTHSDDNSTYTNVADADVQGVTGVTNGIVKALTAAHAAATNTRIGYVGNRRYLKLLADFSGTHGTGTPVAAFALLGDLSSRPAA